MPYDALIKKWSPWLFANGGKETLQSYGFWENRDPSPAVMERIRSDMAWMRRLPIYLELEAEHPSGLPAVVSHSNITQVWHLRRNPDKAELFKDVATRTRDLMCDETSGIFNIFGHTPSSTRYSGTQCVNVDSGCCYPKEGLGKLTAYCVEEDRFVSI